VLQTLGIPASVHVPRYEPFAAPPQVRLYYGNPFLTFERAHKSPFLLAFKHTLDLLAAALLVLLLSPLLVIVSFAIWLRMGRPVFFTQERAGLFGRRFRMVKFRTMCPGAENERDQLASLNEMDGPVFKISADPRLTPLGRWLRQWSIDELPQLFNVLEGTMSLVGPRPHAIAHNEEYRKVIKGYMVRHKVLPGMTGLAQVNGCRGETRTVEDMQARIEYDLDYLRRWSPRLDLKIIVKTALMLLSDRKAY
jgi:putative colanic acid biosynthesis UDP-glucose lipid carrier transferase